MWIVLTLYNAVGRSVHSVVLVMILCVLLHNNNMCLQVLLLLLKERKEKRQRNNVFALYCVLHQLMIFKQIFMSFIYMIHTVSGV